MCAWLRMLRSVPTGISRFLGTITVSTVSPSLRMNLTWLPFWLASTKPAASSLGLTPREHSSGVRRRLGRISKRGDCYLRMLLIHGARSVLWSAHRPTITPSSLQQWGLRLQQERGYNKATVALANKLARRVWAVWKRDLDYPADYRAA